MSFLSLTNVMQSGPARLLLVNMLLLACWPTYAELRTALSASEIEELDSVQLVIQDLGSRDTQTPDLSALDANFQVLGVNTSSQYQFINGRAQSWVDYLITLQPKRTGQVVIAPIAIGNKRTPSLTLKVRPLSDAVLQQISDLVFYELELSADTIYVQSQLLLTRKLFYVDGVQLYGGQLAPPDIEAAQVLTLGEDRSYSVTRAGRTMGVYEQRYAIFPERSGALTIPAESINASVPLDGATTRSRKTVKVASKERTVKVQPIPPAYPADQPWLPAKSVTANANYQPDLSQFAKVGDTIRQVVTINVRGNTGASIAPNTNTVDTQVFRNYPQPVNIKNDLSGSGVFGVRTEAVDLVPITPGAHRLPARTITWWNTDTEQVMTTSIETMALTVTGPATQTEQPPSTASTPPRPAEAQVGGTIQSHANSLDWAAVVAALVALSGIGLLRARPRPARPPAENASPPVRTASEQQAASTLKQLQNALKDDEPAVLRNTLASFLTGLCELPRARALDRFAASSEDATTFLEALNAACFAQGEFTQDHRSLGRTAVDYFLLHTSRQFKQDIRASALPELFAAKSR